MVNLRVSHGLPAFFMKTLYLCRHAKSDWSASLPDHDRALTERGINSIPVMAEIWKNLEEIPKLWISSSAHRALRTAQLMSENMNQEIAVKVEHSLYNAAVKNWLEVINALPDTESAIAIFGHNPGVTDTVNYLCESSIGNLSTCSIAKLTFETDNWTEISGGTGSVDWIE